MSRAGLSPSADLITMSRLPSPILKHHSSMWAYGYHFRAEEEDGASFVSFDGGVAAIITQTCVSSRADQNPVDAELLYVGIIKDILEVDYGHIKRNVLKCSWIKPHLRGEPTIRRDADGFWSVKYASRQAAGVEPYLQPLHARQVYFVDDPLDREWKVVRYKNPRSKRVTDGLSKGSLSAPGRLNATQLIFANARRENPVDEVPPEPVLRADYQHVMAHEERDDEAAYAQVDHEDAPEEEPEVLVVDSANVYVPVHNPIDDN
ncbi:hypothetical protein M758_6G174600 [Ceratodon purpureus]|nr:hypothetical protein M758_6G174600 [Ceratodon purpureus]